MGKNWRAQYEVELTDDESHNLLSLHKFIEKFSTFMHAHEVSCDILTPHKQLQLESQQMQYAAGQTANELPFGWIALQDLASGRTNYANQSTGESWDLMAAKVCLISNPI